MAANSSGGYTPMTPVQEASIRRLADAFTSRGLNPQITAGGWGGLAQGVASLAQAAAGKMLENRAERGRQARVDQLMSTFGAGVDDKIKPLVAAFAESGDLGSLYTIQQDAEDRRKRDESRARVESILSGGAFDQPQTQPAGSGYQPGTIEAQPLAPVSGYRGRLASLESSGDPLAKNPNSSATGRYQPIASTWADQGMDPARITDPMAQEEFLTKFLDSNASSMRPWLGRDPTDTEQYAAHRLGADGARMLYTNAPDMRIENAIGPEAVRVNPDLQGKTVGQVRSMFAQKMPQGQTWANSGQQAQPDYSQLAQAFTGGGGQDAIAGGGQPQQFPAAGGQPAPQDMQALLRLISPVERAMIDRSEDPEGDLLKILQGKMDAQGKQTAELQNRGSNIVNLLLPDGKTVRAFDANRDQNTISNLLRSGAREVDADFQAGGGQGGPFPGSSVPAAALNIIYDYKGKRERGELTTPDEDRAYNIAVGQTAQVITEPSTGQQYIYSPITRQIIPTSEIPGLGGSLPDGPLAPAGTAATPDGAAGAAGGGFDESSTVLEAAGEGTGFTAGLARWYQGTLGQVPGAPQADETVAASNAIRIINQSLKQALVNNPRFPVAEQEVVARMLPDPDSIFTNPGDQQNKLRQLHQFIVAKMRANQSRLATRGISMDRRKELMDQNADMQSVIELLQSLPVIGQAGGPDQPGRLKYGDDGTRVR